MFENFLNYGSVVGVLCLVYASNVAIEVSSRARGGHQIGSAVGQNMLGTLLVLCAIPCILWPAVYVGGFDGWLAGGLAWIVFQLIGAIFSLTLRIRGALLGLHVLTGIVGLGVGYYLTLNNLPWKPSEPLAHEYQTAEFQDPESPMPVMLLCMFMSDRYGYAPDATELIMDVIIGNGVTPDDFDRLQKDAVYFVATALDGNTPISTWKRFDCGAKITEVRRILES